MPGRGRPPKRRPAGQTVAAKVKKRPASLIDKSPVTSKSATSSMIVQALASRGEQPVLHPLVKEVNEKTSSLSTLRLNKFGAKYLSAVGGQRSLLERIQTLESVERNYQELVRLFAAWQSEDKLQDSIDPYDLCLQFLDLLDVMFLGGSDHSDATKMWAALRAHIPRLNDSIAGTRRVQKALAAWWKRSPGGGGREVWPEEVAFAVAGVLFENKLALHAVGVVSEMDSYLRPGEMDELTVKQLVPPQPGRSSCWAILTHPSEDQQPGKTGIVDGTILLDGVNQTLWNTVLPGLVGNRQPNELLLPLAPAGKRSISQAFKDAVKTLGLEELHIVRYGLRHMGASKDLASNARSLTEVKDRGGWRSDSSMARYAKVARMSKSSQKIPKKFCVMAHRCKLVSKTY